MTTAASDRSAPGVRPAVGRRFAAPLALAMALVLQPQPRAPGRAPDATAARIDEVVEAAMRRQRIPGVALAVVRDGHTVTAKGYGYANVEHGVPVTAETVFQSGSIGKQFTAAAVMVLVEDGRLSLDDHISEHLPSAPASWRPITVRHLLTHTSGMAEFFAPGFDLRRDFDEEELLGMVMSEPLLFAPGERWSYSNLGYMTLGILIRQLTGKFYGDFLQERVFRPLGMNSARVIDEASIVPHRAAGYRLVGGELANQEWVSPSLNTTADGSLYLSLLDMLKWDAALRAETLLRRPALEQVFQPVTLDGGTTRAYGFGWHTAIVHGHRVAYHGGSWQGFQSFVLRFLDERLSIVLFTNLAQAHTWKLARELAALFHPELAVPAFTTTADREPEVTAMVKKTLVELAGGRADPDWFAPATRATMFPARVEELGDRIHALSVPPAIVSMAELVERREESGLRVYRYVLTDVGSTLLCTVALDGAGKIVSLAIAPFEADLEG